MEMKLISLVLGMMFFTSIAFTEDGPKIRHFGQTKIDKNKMNNVIPGKKHPAELSALTGSAQGLVKYNVEDGEKGEKESLEPVREKPETTKIRRANIDSIEPERYITGSKSALGAVAPMAVYGDYYEPNDYYWEAYDISFDESTWLSDIDGPAYLDATVDWFEIYVTPGYERVIINMPYYDNYDGHIWFELYDGSGNRLTTSVPDYIADEESLDFEVSAPGKYFIKVTGTFDLGIEYDLWWDDIAPIPNWYDDDYYEINNTQATAYDLIDWEGWLLSDIDGYGIQADDDWYVIYVGSNDYRRIMIDLLFYHIEGDIDIQLVNEYGTVLASSRSLSDNEYIDYTVSRTGYYYIRVFYDNDANYYDMQWYLEESGSHGRGSGGGGGCFIGSTM